MFYKIIYTTTLFSVISMVNLFSYDVVSGARIMISGGGGVERWSFEEEEGEAADRVREVLALPGISARSKQRVS